MGYGGSDEGLCIRWFDFIPFKGVPTSASTRFRYAAQPALLFTTLKNPIIPGRVRYCPKNNGPLINVPQDLTKKDY